MSVTLSTCRATEEQAAKFKSLVEKLGFARPTDFWRRALETLIKQVESGQKLKWPLEFVQEPSERAERARKGPHK